MTNPQFFLSIFISFLFLSCNKYKPYLNQYPFKSETGIPDYADLDYWAAHPWKKDPSDSIPSPLYQSRDSIADIFFLHPTTFTKKKRKATGNALIDDRFINAKTDYSTILFQASVFNEQSRVFAPRYRQAHISNFFSEDSLSAIAAFDLAYKDVKTAFEYYLEHYHSNRPIVIAAHSQGSLLAKRLLKDFFDNNDPVNRLKDRLVVGYLAGWPIAAGYFTYLKMCTDSIQTGCLCSWRTFRKGYVPSYLKNEPDTVYVTNPLIWTTNGEYASRHTNKGSVLTRFNKLFPHTTDARVHKNFLYVSKPRFPWGFLYLTRNYHIGDINLFYMNIRENVRQRISAYYKTPGR